jgi:hypothetical protein
LKVIRAGRNSQKQGIASILSKEPKNGLKISLFDRQNVRCAETKLDEFAAKYGRRGQKSGSIFHHVSHEQVLGTILHGKQNQNEKAGPGNGRRGREFGLLGVLL